ncbi:MAG: hypothetical protein ABIL68_14735 [bacterium]
MVISLIIFLQLEQKYKKVWAEKQEGIGRSQWNPVTVSNSDRIIEEAKMDCIFMKGYVNYADL